MTNRDKTKSAPTGGRGGIATADDDACVTNPPLKEEHQRHSEYAGDPHEDVDAMSEDSFPASDPPSYGGATPGAGDMKRSAAPVESERKTTGRVSETKPHKPAGSEHKSVEELAKQKWPGTDAEPGTS